ncbi:hypothetical protein CesoFtcFv8_014315 [Champsocephalus esox]|uniref:Uncharacterized protein n=1 Tax=Champsocephalus esox TaxID=159716 RepID=A0AAN8BTH5_9TELE|nr:hypothetical protein CesoFtcFv8_014315 [Champsocephalus esox]
MEGNTRKQASPDFTENSMYRVQRKFGDAQSSHGILCPGEVQCGAGWNFFLQSIFSQRQRCSRRTCCGQTPFIMGCMSIHSE